MTAGTMTPVGATLPTMPDERDIREALMVLKLVAARPRDPDLWLEFVQTAVSALESEPPARPRTESVGAPRPDAAYAPVRLGPGKKHARPSHETRGAAGFGYRWSEDRSAQIPIPSELRTLAKIMDLRREGTTLSAIASFLNENGFRSRSGKPWNLQTVKVQINRLEDYPNLRADVDLHGR